MCAKSDAKQANLVTVHVRDESKGAEAERDFTCDRELLVSEMGYFRDYLIRDGEFIGEVEILVHCDIKIFDWLMKYVKRRSEPKNYQECWLSVSNVLALLISSDFLKMDGLSAKCLTYFCEHINAVIASPCSLSCLSDDLLRRIAARLTVEEIEKMKDKKDKLKRYLLQRLGTCHLKKILQLFDRDQHSDESPGNAFGLFQCSICNQLMTAATAAYVPCFPSRRVVTQSGDLVPLHKPLPTTTTGILKDNSFVRRSSSCHGSNFTSFGGVDSLHHDDGFIVRSRNISRTPSSLSTSLPSRVPSTPNLICSSPITAIHNTNESAASGGSETTGDRNLFSVTELLGHWLRELGNWRLVYWKLWSVINMESCSRCGRRFPIIELGDGCFYHPAKPVKLDRGEKNDMMGDGVDSAAHVAARSDGLSTPPTPLALNSRSQPDSSSRPDALCPEFMYPCCGQRLFRFDPFETQTGCHRNEHILVEKFGDEDCVRRHLLQHRDLILSWAPKRSFNPNNAPGLMTVGGFPVPPFEVDYLRSRDELLRKIPSFLMATYLRKTDDDEKADEFFGEYLSKANVADKVTSPVYEIVGGVIADGDNSEPLPTMVHGSMLPSAAGLLSAAMSGHTWDCMKCYRINQDSQRQEDLRRMYKLSEFLYSQRTGTGPCTDETESKELNSGIYARLESQWSSQLRGSNASRLLTIQQMKLMKRLNQLYPGKP